MGYSKCVIPKPIATKSLFQQHKKTPFGGKLTVGDFVQMLSSITTAWNHEHVVTNVLKQLNVKKVILNNKDIKKLKRRSKYPVIINERFEHSGIIVLCKPWLNKTINRVS